MNPSADVLLDFASANPNSEFAKAIKMATEAAEARALKYEQALREIARLDERIGGWTLATAMGIARAALDKPGTEVENSANEVENLLTKGLWKQVFDLDQS